MTLTTKGNNKMENSIISETTISAPNPTDFREAWRLYRQSRMVFGGRTPEASAFVSAAKAAFREAVAPSWRESSGCTEFVQAGNNYPSAMAGWVAESREIGIDGVVVVLLHHPVKGWAMTWWQ